MEIPKKFQNEDGTLNADAVIKSYAELEKKIGTMVSVPGEDADAAAREKFMRATGVPDNAGEYPTHPLLDDESIREKFKEAGMSKRQVEKIYEMADEFLRPAISELMAKKYEDESLAELKSFFGGDEKMRETLSAIETFGEKFLPEDTYLSLCSTPAGIRSIHAMMQSMEPQIATGKNSHEDLSDAALREMMKDPKYWRDRDAEYVRKIENGFKKLYA
jgi:hypothetical protein